MSRASADPSSLVARVSVQYEHVPAGEGCGFEGFCKALGYTQGSSSKMKAVFVAARVASEAAFAANKLPEWQQLVAGTKDKSKLQLQILALPRA